MPRKKEYLSPSEWELMNVIWDLGGKPTVKNVVDTAYPGGEKAYTTVHTIMDILVDKGFLKKEKFGPINLYPPLRKRTEAVRKETDIFINKVFGGSFQKMANFMLETRKLSEDEYEYLKSLIENKEKNSGDDE
ncbi:MAG: BlaI/MecI/CopY family transcriptional regulator [bacterium]|nr:BlaI/MecI/CopY family transcriptional regulator [bacterium]